MSGLAADVAAAPAGAQSPPCRTPVNRRCCSARRAPPSPSLFSPYLSLLLSLSLRPLDMHLNMETEEVAPAAEPAAASPASVSTEIRWRDEPSRCSCLWGRRLRQLASRFFVRWASGGFFLDVQALMEGQWALS